MKELQSEITINGIKYYSAHAVAERQTDWYNLGIANGKKANGYSVDDIKQLLTDYSHIHHLWFDKGNLVGKSAGYSDGYNDGYEQCKHDGISKINYNTESVEQTELSKEYDKGFTKGFEEGKSEGYEIGKKANGISTKEIPGEYLSHIEEAYDDGYKEGYMDCREVAKMLNKYGIDDDDGVAE